MSCAKTNPYMDVYNMSLMPMQALSPNFQWYMQKKHASSNVHVWEYIISTLLHDNFNL